MNYAEIQNIIQENIWSLFEKLNDLLLDEKITQRQMYHALDGYNLLAEYIAWERGSK